MIKGRGCMEIKAAVLILPGVQNDGDEQKTDDLDINAILPHFNQNLLESDNPNICNISSYSSSVNCPTLSKAAWSN